MSSARKQIKPVIQEYKVWGFRATADQGASIAAGALLSKKCVSEFLRDAVLAKVQDVLKQQH